MRCFKTDKSATLLQMLLNKFGEKSPADDHENEHEEETLASEKPHDNSMESTDISSLMTQLDGRMKCMEEAFLASQEEILCKLGSEEKKKKIGKPGLATKCSMAQKILSRQTRTIIH